jgi:DNA-binding Xre family transcriptional regulator
MISYEPLWQTMKDKGMTQYKLLNAGFDNHTLQSLRENKSVTMHTLEKICNILDCTPNDVIMFKE